MAEKGQVIPLRATKQGDPLAETEAASVRASATVQSKPLPATDMAETVDPGSVEGSLGEAAVHVGDELPLSSGPSRYETGPRIGSGGMGEVVLQIDRNIGRAVAKKMLHPEISNPVAVQRFVREARVQGQLEHPAVVPVHDFGVDADGRLFFSMKKIRGQTLQQILDKLALRDKESEARFTRRKLLSAFVSVCLAVEYAHKRGVIHRDLKPSNIMLGDFGEVYILDWGLAKLTTLVEATEVPLTQSSTRPSLSPGMTSEGDFLGTPLYMAPEQFLGKHTALDRRADVYSLGVILFEILTREPYRKGTSIADLLDAAESVAPIERPSARAPDVPGELDDICAAALVVDPSARTSSARALADAVERYLEGDRDLIARRAQAEELLASARGRATRHGKGREAELVTAMQEVLKALALVPGDHDAQRLLVSLMLEGSGELSPEAAEAFEQRDAEVHVLGLRRGLLAYYGWICTIPFAFVVGIRAFAPFWVMAGLTVACIAVGLYFVRVRPDVWGRSPVPPIVLCLLSATIIMTTSAWLGPFIVVPIATCAGVIMFLMHLQRHNQWTFLAIWIVALLIPFAVEILHLVPPAYSFSDGELVLHPRMLNLPEGPTIGFLVYSSVGFVAFLGYFVAQLRRKQHDAERRLFGQAWLLQRLFPADDAGEKPTQPVKAR